jgi:Tol biopolymer transport system component
MDMNGGVKKKLAGEQAWVGENVWAENGLHIAFTGIGKCDGVEYWRACGLFSVNVQNGIKTLIVSDSRAVCDFAWLNSRQLIYSTSDGLHVANADGTGITLVVQTTPPQICPTRSARLSDTQVLLIETGPEREEVSLVNVYDFTKTRISRDGDRYCREIAASDEGEYVSFSCIRDRNVYGYILEAASLDVVRILDGGQFGYSWSGYRFFWSPNSQYLAVNENGRVAVLPMDKPKGGLKRLLSVPILLQLQWSSDSQYLAVRWEQSASNEAPQKLHVVSADGTRNIQLEADLPRGAFGERTNGLTWSADGQYLIYSKYEGSEYGIYRFSIAEWQVERLFSLPPDYPIFSMNWQP